MSNRLHDRFRSGQHIASVEESIHLIARKCGAHPDGDDDGFEVGAQAIGSVHIDHFGWMEFFPGLFYCFMLNIF